MRRYILQIQLGDRKIMERSNRKFLWEEKKVRKREEERDKRERERKSNKNRKRKRKEREVERPGEKEMYEREKKEE